MFQAIVKVVDRFKKVRAAALRATIGNLNHGAAGIRKDAMAEIVNDPGPSAPGTPPHSRRGQIRNAIIFAKATTHNLSALVGPLGSRVGTAASAHEFGGEYKGSTFPERPFMGPAMDGRLAQFAGSFSGSIGE